MNDDSTRSLEQTTEISENVLNIITGYKTTPEAILILELVRLIRIQKKLMKVAK